MTKTYPTHDLVVLTRHVVIVPDSSSNRGGQVFSNDK